MTRKIFGWLLGTGSFLGLLAAIQFLFVAFELQSNYGAGLTGHVAWAGVLGILAVACWTVAGFGWVFYRKD